MEDQQIIELYNERSETAISETANKYGKYCYYIAYHILYDEQDSEECVNDTYLRAWESIPPQYPNKMSAFLGKITRNLALTRYRYYRREKRGCGQIPLVLDDKYGGQPEEPDSDLVIGSSVWVGFQKFDYVVGNGKYKQIFAYHVVERDDSIATENEPLVELTLEEAVSDAKFGNLFPATILDGYVLQDTVAVLNDTVLVANFYNKTLSDELTIPILM